MHTSKPFYSVEMFRREAELRDNGWDNIFKMANDKASYKCIKFA